MSFDATVNWSIVLAAVTFLISLGGALYSYIANRRANVEDRFQAGNERADRQENRIASLEQSVKSMPSREDVHKIELSMERMNGTMTRVEAVMEGNQKIMSRLENVVFRHEDHLLKRD
ncbi:DUF2730 family protein [Phaeobacter inhibens]|uniref:DUF2730 family protein n=1 Tax=Phaeobacter inhibens TaxID=221822 RepID=UPI00076BB70F|nr:DUF2730 family protein [Phaeobacter inhibens]KXF92103.1 hypothetical protein AT574_03875 [Phaeobacter inhibens]WHP69938.1 DUF2730 family protein [Phaeobacter inhibens]